MTDDSQNTTVTQWIQTASEDNSYQHLTLDWPQHVYYAWVLYGAVSFQLALYWCQRFYMENWYGYSDDYISRKPTLYTYFGMGETINRGILISMWTTSVVLWLLTLIQVEELFWFFTIWARVLNCIDVVRLLLVILFKIIGMFDDVKSDYYTDDGTNLDAGYSTNVSMAQSISGTDWYMEAFGLGVSFSLYGDLLGISDWAMKAQEHCLKNGVCKIDAIWKTQAEIDALRLRVKQDDEEAADEQQLDLANFSDEVTPTWAGTDTSQPPSAVDTSDLTDDDSSVDSELNY